MDEWPTKSTGKLTVLRMMSIKKGVQTSPASMKMDTDKKCITLLGDKLGPWNPSRDWLSDQLRTPVHCFSVLLVMCDSNVTVRMCLALSLKFKTLHLLLKLVLLNLITASTRLYFTAGHCQGNSWHLGCSLKNPQNVSSPLFSSSMIQFMHLLNPVFSLFPLDLFLINMSVLPVFFFAHYLTAKDSLKSECIVKFRGINIKKMAVLHFF